MIVLPVLALIAGVGFGLTYRTNDPRPTQTAEDTVAEGASPDSGGASLVVVITSIRDEGSSVRLTWIDPTDGEALFIITEMIGDDESRPLRTIPPGETEAVINGLDPTAPQYCFRVLAVGALSGASATTCTSERSAGA